MERFSGFPAKAPRPRRYHDPLATMRTRKDLPTRPPRRRRPRAPGTDGKTDREVLAARDPAPWAPVDFTRIGATPPIVGELLCEAVDLHASERVLDIAAG